jgi:hypothetical protein
MCSGGLCHDIGPEHPFYFKDDCHLYTALTTHVTADCGPSITKGSPENSALVKLLKASCGGTPRMPYDKCFDESPPDYEFCVPPATIALMETWIRNGAPEN